MRTKVNVVLVLVGLVITSLVSTASAIAGYATYYNRPLPYSCGSPQETMVAAVNYAVYDNGAACGRMYRVTCTGPTNFCKDGNVTVKIVDRCPQNRIDLSAEAFSQIAEFDPGIITIEYAEV